MNPILKNNQTSKKNNLSSFVRRGLLVAIAISIGLFCGAQVVVTAKVTPGNLNEVIQNNFYEISDLTLKGKIDARDFRFMRDWMPKLKMLDLTQTTIVEYRGTKGPAEDGTEKIVLYPANVVPENAFYRPAGFDFDDAVDPVLTSIKFPNTAIEIDKNAFESCFLLESITFPPSLKHLAEWAFDDCTGVKTIYMNSTIPPKCDSSDFLSKITESADFFVPKGTLAIYKAAFDWNQFVKMKER